MLRLDTHILLQEIIDKVTVVLPWSVEEIVTAFGDIVEAISRISRNPKTAISDIGKGATR